MAAPTPTSRILPSGFKLEDGYRTTVAFSLNPAMQFWEKTIKPPGIDGGDPINTTTMLNNVWRTFAPKRLKTLTESSGKCAYDTAVLPGLFNIINLPASVTVAFPNNAKLAFYGFLQKFDIDEHVEGEMPLSNYVVGITNWDYVNYVEAGPLYVASPGTP